MCIRHARSLHFLALVIWLFSLPVTEAAWALSWPWQIEMNQCYAAVHELKAGLLPQPATPTSVQKADWTDLEIAVWHHLCDRRSLLKDDWGAILKKLSLQPETVPRLDAIFIKAIIASNKFDVPDFDYIHIEGATVTSDLDLSHEILRSSLILRDCIFTGNVTAQVAGSISPA